jgi:uncharacterized protein (TIGR02996 family)
MYRKDDPAVLAEWSNLDSRYNGPKSEYGQYRAKAQAMVERLEAAIPENFRAMFAEHPNERGVRLVLADWCEEQGMPDVGAALRA